MNKLKIALLAAAAVYSAGAMSAEVYKSDGASLSVYGRVKAEVMNGYGYVDQSLKTDAEDHPGFIGSARLGVSGESKVNDFFTAFGNIYYDLSAEDGIDANDRMNVYYGWVGMRFGDYGELLGGHMEPAAYRALAPVDVFEDWGFAGNGASLDLHNTGAANRQDGIIMYQADDLGGSGIGFSVSYRFRDAGDNTKNGVSAGLSYDTPIGLGLTAGYQYNKAIDKSVTGDRTETILGAYYGAFGEPGFYGAGVYNHTKLNTGDHMSDDSVKYCDEDCAFSGDGFDLVASYTTPEGMFTFTADWGYMKNQWRNSDSDVAVNQIVGNITWNINEQAQLLVEYVDNFADGEGDAYRDAHQDLLTLDRKSVV